MTDNFNHPTELDPQRKELAYQDRERDGGKEEEKTFNSKLLYDWGLGALAKAGVELVPSIEGDFAYHSLYLPVKPTAEPGYQPPADFTYQKLGDDNAAHNTLIEGYENISRDSEALKNYWQFIANPSIERKKPLHAMARHKITVEAKRVTKNWSTYVDGISIAGSSGAKCFVPQKEWFDPLLHQVTAADLLTILPPAEQEMLQLLLGRIIVGRDNSFTVEGTHIQHTFRCFALVVGQEAGMGKSTLMNQVINAMGDCGYNTEVMPSFMGRFGWGKVAESNFTFIDDLTVDSQKALINHPTTKQLVSGGLMVTEKKGVDSVNVRSRTVLLACTNTYNPSHLRYADSGVISRAQALYTYRKPELDTLRLPGLSSGSKDLRVRQHWEWLASKLQVTSKTLALWLLHLCAEKFLDSCGYRKTEFGYQFNGYNALEENVRELQKHYRLKPHVDEVQSVFQAIRFYQLKHDCCTEDLGSEELMVYIAKVGEMMDNQPLMEKLKQDFEEQKRPLWHPYLGLSDCLNYRTIGRALEGLKKKIDIEYSEVVLIETLFSLLSTKSGFKMSTSTVHIRTCWDIVKLYDPCYESLEYTP